MFRNLQVLRNRARVQITFKYKELFTSSRSSSQQTVNRFPSSIKRIIAQFIFALQLIHSLPGNRYNAIRLKVEIIKDYLLVIYIYIYREREREQRYNDGRFNYVCNISKTDIKRFLDTIDILFIKVYDKRVSSYVTHTHARKLQAAERIAY